MFPDFITLADLLAYYNTSSSSQEDELFDYFQSNPSNLDQLAINQQDYGVIPLSLPEAKFLEALKFDFIKHRTFIHITNPETFIYLLNQLDFASNLLLFLFALNLECLKILLVLEKIKIQSKLEIGYPDSLTLHSLYYFVNGEEPARYLYENGLSLEENFKDLFMHNLFLYFYEDFNIALISEKNFKYYLSVVDSGNYIGNINKKYLKQHLDFIQKVLTLKDYKIFEGNLDFSLSPSKNFVRLFYRLWENTQDNFIYSYLKLNLTEEIILNYLKNFVDNTNFIYIIKFYGFENLSFVLHEKILELYFNNGFLLYIILRSLEKNRYPYLAEMKKDYLEKFWEYLRKKETEQNYQICLKKLSEEMRDMPLEELIMTDEYKEKVIDEMMYLCGDLDFLKYFEIYYDYI